MSIQTRARGRFVLVAFALLLSPVPAMAATFYVDAVAGNDRNAGTTPATAWRTLDKVAQESRNKKLRKNGFAPGDQVLFRRGQRFSTPSSSSNPIVQVNGTALAPVVLDAWGEGTPPRLDNDRGGIYDWVLRITGTSALVRNLAITRSDPANVTEHGLHMIGTGHRVTACDIAGVGIGVKLEGGAHRVDHNLIHDLTMVIADASPDNDYGAMGVLVSRASQVEVDHNRFERLRAASPDYGHDGAALEIFNAASDLRFHHNTVLSASALTEAGGDTATDLVTGLRYFHNLVLDTDSVGYFHNDAATTYGLRVEDVRFEHNTFSKTNTTMHSWLLGFGMAPAVGRFAFRNNIVEHRNSHGLFWRAGALEHASNLYALSNAPFGDPGFVLAPTEVLDDPGFADPTHGNYRLTAGSMAIDLGLSLGYTADLDELPMPWGEAPDLGAYEFR